MSKEYLIYDSTLTSIADAIRDKGVSGNFKPSQMADAISSITSSGNSLWCLGDNPTLVYDDTYPQSFTLTDIGYKDKTITTTSQTLKATGAMYSKQLPVTYNDIVNYDFICLGLIEYNIVYTEDPIRRVIKGGQLAIQNLWVSQQDGTKISNQACLMNVMYRTDASGNPMYFSENNYAVKFSASPWSTLSNKNYIVWRNPSISVQAHATYMPVESFDKIDYDNSTYKAHAFIYRVDKNTSFIAKSQQKLRDYLNN